MVQAGALSYFLHATRNGYRSFHEAATSARAVQTDHEFMDGLFLYSDVAILFAHLQLCLSSLPIHDGPIYFSTVEALLVQLLLNGRCCVALVIVVAAANWSLQTHLALFCVNFAIRPARPIHRLRMLP